MSRKKAATAVMDFFEKDTELSPEEQLDGLRRAYRPAELKRLMFYSKTKSALDKQQHIIDILDKEKADLEFRYNKAREAIFLRQDAMWLRGFEDLLNCQSTSKAIKDEEIQKIKETDEKIRQLDKRMHQLRLKLVQMHKSRCPTSSNEKIIKILENKLYQESVAHNKAIYKNSILREYIQHLLILRTHFNIIYNEYNRILSKGKGKIEHLSKEAVAAQEQRDEIRSHLIFLDKYSIMQYNKLVLEVQEMSRMAKLKGQHLPFMMKKEKTRAGYLESFGTKLEVEKADTRPEEQLKFYQDTYEKIKAATHQTDANEIVKYFIKAEEDNFKLFNYANELRDESEHIQEKINSFQERLREANMQDKIEEEKFDATKEMMEQQLKKIAVDRSSLQEKLDLCQKAFSEFQEGITKLYSKSGCSDEYLHNMLYGGKGITKHSILVYLSVLESWISDLIPFSDYLVTRKKSSGVEDKETEKMLTSPKFEVLPYSKLSAISGNIAPSIQTSSTSGELSPATEDVKTLSFPDFDFSELSREPSSPILDDLQPLKQPYSKSELKIIANETLWKSEAAEERLIKK